MLAVEKWNPDKDDKNLNPALNSDNWDVSAVMGGLSGQVP